MGQFLPEILRALRLLPIAVIVILIAVLVTLGFEPWRMSFKSPKELVQESRSRFAANIARIAAERDVDLHFGEANVLMPTRPGEARWFGMPGYFVRTENGPKLIEYVSNGLSPHPTSDLASAELAAYWYFTRADCGAWAVTREVAFERFHVVSLDQRPPTESEIRSIREDLVQRLLAKGWNGTARRLASGTYEVVWKPLGYAANVAYILLLMAAVVSMQGVVQAVQRYRRNSRVSRGLCGWCGYERTSLSTDSVCPECGRKPSGST